jgi:hypothetical protein
MNHIDIVERITNHLSLTLTDGFAKQCDVASDRKRGNGKETGGMKP